MARPLLSFSFAAAALLTLGAGAAAGQVSKTTSKRDTSLRDTMRYTSALARGIPEVFTEDFGGPAPGFRFKVRAVDMDGNGRVAIARRGGLVDVSMEVLHDCISCGNAVNQIIVGLGGEPRAQASVWNGKQRSGGPVMVVNPGQPVAALCEDNPGPAEWVRVYYSIRVPSRPGVYYLRARYAQDYQGNLMTEAGLEHDQPAYETVLGWWRVDRPEGPGADANIGAIVVR